MALLQGSEIDRDRIKASFKVTIDGQDVSSAMAPFLVSLQVVLDDEKLWTGDIELSDRHGVLKMPDIGGKMEIELGWESTTKVYEGVIEKRVSQGQRKSGRRLSIHAKGTSVVKAGKTQQRDTVGEGEKPDGTKDSKTFKEAAQKFAKDAGYQVKMDGLDDIKRPSWSITNEHFMAWAARMSRELGLIFTMEGDTANFSKMGEGKSSSGQQIADIEVKWAEDGNLKAWQISPASGRPAWKNMNASWFDRLEGKRRYVNAAIEGLLGDAKSMGAKASFFAPFEAFTEEQAKAQAKSDSSASRQALAEGWVVIRGEPKATPQAKVLLKGVREGVDGNYIIKKVTHTYKRGGGFETLLDLGDPGVQSDNRGGDSGKANP